MFIFFLFLLYIFSSHKENENPKVEEKRCSQLKKKYIKSYYFNVKGTNAQIINFVFGFLWLGIFQIKKQQKNWSFPRNFPETRTKRCWIFFRLNDDFLTKCGLIDKTWLLFGCFFGNRLNWMLEVFVEGLLSVIQDGINRIMRIIY